MDRSERFYRIDQLLNERGVVTREAFLEELEVSLATFKRDLEYMRDRYNAPVVWTPTPGATGSTSGRTPVRDTSCRACGSARAKPWRCSRWSTCCLRWTTAA